MINIFDTFIKTNNLNCIKTKVASKDLTTIKCGGEVDYLAEPENIDELSVLFQFICSNNIPYKILGNGSNVLISDMGFNGVFFSLKNLPYSIEQLENTLTVVANIECINLQKKCILEGLSGLEFLSGIPGTIGGLIAMNAGAFDHDISEVLVSLQVLNDQGDEVQYIKDNIDFSYRKTSLPISKFIITEGTFRVKKENMHIVKQRSDEYMSRRRSSNLWQVSTFGSTFKNGSNFYAGELIEKCGLKGFSIGDAYISNDHANFIINKGNASAEDVYLLIQKMKNDVKKKFDKDLELEVKLWGDFRYAGK